MDDQTNSIPNLKIIATMACTHTIEYIHQHSITCYYQWLLLPSNDKKLYHVIHFKNGLPSTMMVKIGNYQQQLFYNVKGDIEYVYEGMLGPVISSVHKLQPASGLIVDSAIDELLRYHMELLLTRCTHTVLSDSTKGYLDEAYAISLEGFVHFFRCAVKYEKNMKVAFKNFLKNIHAALQLMLFVPGAIKRKSGSSASPSSGTNGGKRSVADTSDQIIINNQRAICQHCKFKNHRVKFKMYNYYKIHVALCNNVGRVAAAPNSLTSSSAEMVTRKKINQDTLAEYTFRSLGGLIVKSETTEMFNLLSSQLF